MTVKGVLHFTAVNIFAARDDHVFPAIDEEQIVALVEPSHVAGAQVLAVHRSGGRLRILPVPEEAIGIHANLANRALRHRMPGIVEEDGIDWSLEMSDGSEASGHLGR